MAVMNLGDSAQETLSRGVSNLGLGTPYLTEGAGCNTSVSVIKFPWGITHNARHASRASEEARHLSYARI
jgi:hypothetical protein